LQCPFVFVDRPEQRDPLEGWDNFELDLAARGLTDEPLCALRGALRKAVGLLSPIAATVPLLQPPHIDPTNRLSSFLSTSEDYHRRRDLIAHSYQRWDRDRAADVHQFDAITIELLDMQLSERNRSSVEDGLGLACEGWAGPLSIAGRLIRENGWEVCFAARLVEPQSPQFLGYVLLDTATTAAENELRAHLTEVRVRCRSQLDNFSWQHVGNDLRTRVREHFFELRDRFYPELFGASPTQETTTLPSTPPPAAGVHKADVSSPAMVILQAGDNSTRPEPQMREGEQVARRSTAASGRVDNPTKQKRGTAPGEGEAKLKAALTLHHQYANGSCLNCEAVSASKLARLARVSKSTSWAFICKQFGNMSSYKRRCEKPSELAMSLKMINGELTPAILDISLATATMPSDPNHASED
jgi:hypothetical protein